MISIRYARNLFLRAVCVVYLFAFISFYVQIPGLYGDNGILPARSVLENSKHKTLSAKVHYQPTLLWLAPYLGLDINYALDVLALLGSFFAFTGFVSQKFCTIPLFAGLWSLYFSLYQIGQVFVTSQWDDLLLEVGFLCLLVAPLLPSRTWFRGSKSSPKDNISFWLVRWLLFRFILTSGLVKLTSGCPKWWDLSALSYHFESTVLPSPLSWYTHHMPEWQLRLSVVFANVCELALPFLFFVPVRSVRITGFVFQIFLQIFIVLTGNFSFLNLLLVTLTISLLDDQFFFGKSRKTPKQPLMTVLSALTNVILHSALFFAVYVLYNIKLNDKQVDAKIGFTKDEFDQVVRQGVMVTLYIGLFSLGLTIARSVANSVINTAGAANKFFTLLGTLLYAGIAVMLFVASTVPIQGLHKATNSSVVPSSRTIYNRLHKLHAVNEYGLFKKMDVGRQEIILEGSNNMEGPWLEYHFLYKPGNVNHSLPFVAPYSPRLDWQMWFAARSTYEKEPWLLSLTHRLLEGRPEVLSLLDKNHSPFGKSAPKYIRASLYKYKYTTWAQRWQHTWWTRERIGEYFPAFSVDTPALVDYLKARSLLPTAPKQPAHAIWKQILDTIRYVSQHLEATLLLWSVFTAGCAIITTTTTKSK